MENLIQFAKSNPFITVGIILILISFLAAFLLKKTGLDKWFWEK